MAILWADKYSKSRRPFYWADKRNGFRVAKKGSRWTGYAEMSGTTAAESFVVYQIKIAHATNDDVTAYQGEASLPTNCR
jgi:hypothetical protein